MLLRNYTAVRTRVNVLWDKALMIILPNQGGTREKKGKKEMFYLTVHSTHFIYGYMASDLSYCKALSVSTKPYSSNLYV